MSRSNRQLIEEFADVFYRQKNVRKAFMEYVAAEYVQHNPTIPDGREVAIGMLEPMFARPTARFDVKRILVDGDLAMVHLHGRMSDDHPGGAVADIYRLENGKIAEHWDIVQLVPETSINPHPMF